MAKTASPNDNQDNSIRLREQSLDTLRELAHNAGLRDFEALSKPDLVNTLMSQQAEKRGQQSRSGLLEIMNEGSNRSRLPAGGEIPARPQRRLRERRPHPSL